MLIRPASTPDASSIASIHVETWRTAYRGLMPDAVLDSQDVSHRETFWQHHIAQASVDVFVAVENDSIIGFCDLIPSRDKGALAVGEIAAFYVHPEFWRKYAGRMLCQRALERARERHFKSVTLWVLTDNQPARHFYEKMGFQGDGGIKFTTLLDRTELQEMRYRISI